MKLRVAFGIDDDLQEYAQAVAFDGPPLYMKEVEGAQVAVLRQDGSYQVELCCVRGGFFIPEHVHPHADTIEVGVCGAVRLAVNGVDPFAEIPDARLASFTRARGIRINSTDLHGGFALPGGAWFLSFQRWKGQPRSVLTDYVGTPLGVGHAGMMLA